ncbi:hypothetical protein [Paenibacillus qinlingensis]|uniref:hypothetical protein n=1 Tax=Paenibacillus qinlingensis TaxID=1837343 RepID=UPI001567A89E|nr:hypothetical protein [Paenibacillus qinlingensis]NQX63367.1 hypothetical protein [Paenibacillus qinlingensis]
MIHIRSNYPGGNIKVVSLDEVVRLEQDIRDSYWWFYWNFCIRCEEEREIVFEFMHGEVVGPWGPAYSLDGMNWTWLGEQSVMNSKSFVYRFDSNNPEVYFAFSLPYQLQHFETFYEKWKDYAVVHRDTLCLSEQKREVPLLLIGNKDAPQHIFFSSRHHACESTVNYVLEGLLELYLEEHARSEFLDQFCIHYVPFVDIDGVENGDQGKGRMPLDHNRDYIEHSTYAATPAMMRYVSTLQPVVGIDFHCPHKWGERNDHVFFVKTGTEADRRIERLGRLLHDLTQGIASNREIPYDPANDIEMGEEWNEPFPNCSSFMIQHSVPLAVSMEIPYFGLVPMQYTADSLRRLGRCLGQALQIYLRESYK